MVKTGIFFHEIFSRESGPVIGSKFKNFPEALKDVLKLPNVNFYIPKQVSEGLLLKVHTKEYLEGVKKMWYYNRALYSIGGAVEATEKIWLKEITNALVFNSASGHHAGPNYGWGGTYLSCTGTIVHHMRDRYGVGKFAVIDTDSHHGDGTRAVFLNDKDVLHVCFCDENHVEGSGTKVDVDVGWNTTDEEYLSKVRENFIPRVEEFKPIFIFHEFGHDTCQNDYGDRGLSKEFFVKLAKLVNEVAKDVCEGRYVVITHGGARADVAEYIFPRIARVLANVM